MENIRYRKTWYSTISKSNDETKQLQQSSPLISETSGFEKYFLHHLYQQKTILLMSKRKCLLQQEEIEKQELKSSIQKQEALECGKVYTRRRTKQMTQISSVVSSTNGI
jgi:hypothetical protein